MKPKTTILLLVMLMAGHLSSLAQGFTAPAEGKSVVYFTRVSALGFAVSFEYFDGDKFIGDFKGKNYMRYECEPGQHLFWASSENKEFITADLKAGGSYVIVVDVIMGAWKARVGMTPVTTESEVFERAKKLILESAPEKVDQGKVDKKNEKLKKFIEEQLKKYEETWKNEKNFKSITAEMAIPESAMK